VTKYHLAILKKPFLDLILKGQKTIEARLTKTKRPFWLNTHPGDRIFLKQSSGSVLATARVKAVKKYDKLTPEILQQIKHQYNAQICAKTEFWQEKQDSKYAMLITLTEITTIEPIIIDKKDLRAWVVLDETEDFGLLKNLKMLK